MFSHMSLYIITCTYVVVCRYPQLLPYETTTELEKIEGEFLDYQLIEKNEIPNELWDSATVKVDETQKYYRMDMIWNCLSSMTNPDGIPRFSRLTRVAKLVLILPHSNASEERVFSMVTKNKTTFRPNLKLDGTLASILTVKLANPEPCHAYEPEKLVLETAKKATMMYKRSH